MKNIFNNIGISQRCRGQIKDDTVEIREILSYDIVGNPGFFDAKFYDIDAHNKMLEELRKQELLKSRKEKIKKLNNL